MRVLLSWLRDFAPIGDDVDALAHDLSMLGMAVDGIEPVGAPVDGVIVEFEVHAGSSHAFCNEENPLGTHDAVLSDKCWASTIDFLRDRLS